MAIVLTLTVIVTIYITMTFFLWRKRGKCSSTADLTGKTVIITGANTGIGYETALDLASRNARVIVACRDVSKGKASVEQLRKETGNTNICCRTIDMASFKSVKDFATMIRATESRLDILINNAGVTALPYRLTEDKLEYTFQTNYAGQFLLTNLLLDLLKKSAPSRIVNLTSIAHKWGSVQFDNLNSERSFKTGRAYFDSKLEVVLFTRELARRLESTDVTVNCLHPGTVNTQLLRSLPFLLRAAFKVVGFLFFKNVREGAQTTIYCAVSEELAGVSGRYLSECRIATESAEARDDAIARKLWDVTETMVGLTDAQTDIRDNLSRPSDDSQADLRDLDTITCKTSPTRFSTPGTVEDRSGWLEESLDATADDDPRASQTTSL